MTVELPLRVLVTGTRSTTEAQNEYVQQRLYRACVRYLGVGRPVVIVQGECPYGGVDLAARHGVLPGHRGRDASRHRRTGAGPQLVIVPSRGRPHRAGRRRGLAGRIDTGPARRRGIDVMTSRGHKVEHLVRVAYAEALKRKHEDASRTVEQIYKVGGATGLQIALLLWADTYIDHAVDGTDALIVGTDMVFVQTGPGQAETLDPQPADRVPEEFRWAGQLFTARAAMDRTQWNNLVASVPPGEQGKYVFAVLNAVASTVNGLPRGYARIGA